MSYPLLYHNDLDLHALQKDYAKTLQQLQDGDFKSADVRKMQNSGYYRARLNLRDRLLFSMVRCGGQVHLLLLEFIANHNYADSRFLRGAAVPDDEKWLPLAAPDTNAADIATLTYLNPRTPRIHTLNKFLSFDDLQQQVLQIAPPLIIIGSAGSGKTALVLEKLKNLHGTVAYVSLSKFLVDNASKIYYSKGYNNETQEVDFLSLGDYLAQWQKPLGREVDFRRFAAWFVRFEQTVKIHEPYRVYEEFKGVITGSPTHTAFLSEKEYLELGVKQSIFAREERQRLYPLFNKYLEWLNESNLYDSNIVCYEYLTKVKPTYDFIVVDEVQDITNIQLQCILASLNKPSHFILTGDSNQIVHPNFFSWSKVKSYFYKAGTVKEQIEILQTNYRNSLQVVDLSNRLLKIKNARFGSIDRESNYLVNTVSQTSGEVILYADNEKQMRELNRRTKDSAHYAVIVPTVRHKADAARYFQTPLIFSVQEAKGLEYENVILINFVSANEAEFREIINGVTVDDLTKTELTYNRASDKTDKAVEVYKFYINSLYVAVTRAVKNIYIFEHLSKHPALQLLQMQESSKGIEVSEAKSTKEEWLKEAQRLEEQGKIEQAEQIRAKYLGYEYISLEQLEEIKQLALDPAKTENEVKRERKQLFEYSKNHQRFDWLEALAVLKLQRAVAYMSEIRRERKEFAKNVRLGRKNEVYRTIDKFGVDFPCDDGETALMLALQHGQDELAAQLLERGADITRKDSHNLMAIHFLLRSYFGNTDQKQQQMATQKTLLGFWEQTRPLSFTYETENRQYRINGHSMAFFLYVLMRAGAELLYEQNKRVLNEYQLRLNQLMKKEADEIDQRIDDEVRYLATKKYRNEREAELILNGIRRDVIAEVEEETKKEKDALIKILTSIYTPLGVFKMDDFEDLTKSIPDAVLPPYRKKRQYINSVLAGNEVGNADKAQCKCLFVREKRGSYRLNPEIL